MGARILLYMKVYELHIWCSGCSSNESVQVALENESVFVVYVGIRVVFAAVLEEADCGLLLDVNNIYVNSINHRYDPVAFLDSLPLDRARYIHIAGHFDEADDLKVDTHGADIIDPVWRLLDQAYERVGPLPTLLERDFNLPPLSELLTDIERIRAAQSAAIGNEALRA